jgi:hypothetical protein
MAYNLLSKDFPPLLETIALNKKAVRMIFPRLLKYLRPWGTIHLPTAFADYTCVLMISRRQWVNLFGPAVPIKVIATVKVKNRMPIHFHFLEILIL